MKNWGIISAALFVVFLVGCETRQYPSFPEITHQEALAYNCQTLSAEIKSVKQARIEMDKIATSRDKKYLLDDFSDPTYGVLEYTLVVNDAEMRLKQLRTLYARKGCK